MDSHPAVGVPAKTDSHVRSDTNSSLFLLQKFVVFMCYSSVSLNVLIENLVVLNGSFVVFALGVDNLSSMSERKMCMDMFGMRQYIL